MPMTDFKQDRNDLEANLNFAQLGCTGYWVQED